MIAACLRRRDGRLYTPGNRVGGGRGGAAQERGRATATAPRGSRSSSAARCATQLWCAHLVWGQGGGLLRRGAARRAGVTTHAPTVQR